MLSGNAESQDRNGVLDMQELHVLLEDGLSKLQGVQKSSGLIELCKVELSPKKAKGEISLKMFEVILEACHFLTAHVTARSPNAVLVLDSWRWLLSTLK